MLLRTVCDGPATEERRVGGCAAVEGGGGAGGCCVVFWFGRGPGPDCGAGVGLVGDGGVVC